MIKRWAVMSSWTLGRDLNVVKFIIMGSILWPMLWDSFAMEKVKWYIFIVIVNWSSTSVLIYKSHEYIWNMALSKSHSMCSRSTTDVSSCIKQYKLICSLEFTVLVQIQNLMKNTYNDNDSSLGIMATMSSCCNNSKLQESLAIMEQMRERRKN